MSISDLMKAMSDAGAPMEAILIAVRAIEERDQAEAARKAKRAEQKRNERAREAESRATVARQSDDNAATVAEQKPPKVSPQRDINQTPHPNPQKSSLRSDSPHSILAEVLLPETVADLLAHRKAKREPLTARAAKIAVEEMRRHGDPEACAREWILRGWRGFKAEWMPDASPRAGPPRQTERTTILSSLFTDPTDDKPPTDPHSSSAGHDDGAGPLEPRSLGYDRGFDFGPRTFGGREALGDPGVEIIPPRRAWGS